MTVEEIIKHHDAASFTQEHWSFWIFDKSGNIEYGYINAVNPIQNIHESILQ